MCDINDPGLRWEPQCIEETCKNKKWEKTPRCLERTAAVIEGRRARKKVDYKAFEKELFGDEPDEDAGDVDADIAEGGDDEEEEMENLPPKKAPKAKSPPKAPEAKKSPPKALKAKKSPPKSTVAVVTGDEEAQLIQLYNDFAATHGFKYANQKEMEDLSGVITDVEQTLNRDDAAEKCMKLSKKDATDVMENKDKDDICYKFFVELNKKSQDSSVPENLRKKIKKVFTKKAAKKKVLSPKQPEPELPPKQPQAEDDRFADIFGFVPEEKVEEQPEPELPPKQPQAELPPKQPQAEDDRFADIFGFVPEEKVEEKKPLKEEPKKPLKDEQKKPLKEEPKKPLKDEQKKPLKEEPKKEHPPVVIPKPEKRASQSDVALIETFGKTFGVDFNNNEVDYLSYLVGDINSDMKYNASQVCLAIQKDLMNVKKDDAEICKKFIENLEQKIRSKHKEQEKYYLAIGGDDPNENPLYELDVGSFNEKPSKKQQHNRELQADALDAAAMLTIDPSLTKGEIQKALDRNQYALRYKIKTQSEKSQTLNFLNIDQLDEAETNAFLDHIDQTLEILDTLKEKIKIIVRPAKGDSLLTKLYQIAEGEFKGQKIQESAYDEPGQAILDWIEKHAPKNKKIIELFEEWLNAAGTKKLKGVGDVSVIADAILKVSKRENSIFNEYDDIEKDTNFVKAIWAAVTDAGIGITKEFGKAFFAFLKVQDKFEDEQQEWESEQSQRLEDEKDKIRAVLQAYSALDVATLNSPTPAAIDKFMAEISRSLPKDKKPADEKKLNKADLMALCAEYNKDKPEDQQIYYSKTWAADKLAERCSEAAIKAIKDGGPLPPGRGKRKSSQKPALTTEQEQARFEDAVREIIVKETAAGKSASQIDQAIRSDKTLTIDPSDEQFITDTIAAELSKRNPATVQRVSSEDISLGVLLKRQQEAERKAKEEKKRLSEERRDKEVAAEQKKANEAQAEIDAKEAELKDIRKAKQEVEQANIFALELEEKAKTETQRKAAEKKKQRAEELKKQIDAERKELENEKQKAQQAKQKAEENIAQLKEKHKTRKNILNQCKDLFRTELVTRGGRTTKVDEFLRVWMPTFNKHYADEPLADAKACVAQFLNRMLVLAYVQGIILPGSTKTLSAEIPK
jgi:hypothetical protein